MVNLATGSPNRRVVRSDRMFVGEGRRPEAKDAREAEDLISRRLRGSAKRTREAAADARGIES